MVRIKVYQAGETPPRNFPQSGPPAGTLGGDETIALVEAGVWVAGDRANWSRVAPDGSVWAGGAAGLHAKVRGKGGRRLAVGRPPLPPDERRRTKSLQLSDPAWANLEAKATAEARATGRKVTISMIVDRMARHG